jgi:purine-nucleoside phosphorylase
MMHEFQKAKDYFIQQRIENADIGIVLGTGLNHILNHVGILQMIPYSQIPGFPLSTVEFHKGNLIYGTIENKKLLIMQGRFHSYEGYSMQQIVFPIRVMKLLGVQNLFLSNAAGGINLSFKKADLVLLEDHINLQSANPLTGEHLHEFGDRFPDMCEPYDPYLNSLLHEKAKALNINLKKGVYAAVNGPNLETKAEYRYLKIIGADMVGMSTVPEVIAASQMKMPCAAISVITDQCDPDHLKPVNIHEIIATAALADEKLSSLLFETIKAL